jgi:hypothetical protein
MESNLGEVIDKALKQKLPKLARTRADKRILFLERRHMNLYPKSMLDEVEKRKSTCPNLARVDEIWILETMLHERDSYLRFERCENDTLVGVWIFRVQSFSISLKTEYLFWVRPSTQPRPALRVAGQPLAWPTSMIDAEHLRKLKRVAHSLAPPILCGFSSMQHQEPRSLKYTKSALPLAP